MVMTLLELKQDIMQNKLKHFYIFVGEEIGIMNIYLAEMSNKIGLSIQRTERVDEIYSNLGESLFGKTDGFYVVREDRDFIKAESNITEDLGGSYLVLLCNVTDSRLKFFKTYKDSIVEFEKLAPEVLKKYIFRACKLTDSNLDKLCELTGNSYDISMLECDKINQLAHYWKIPTNEAFAILLKNNVIYQKEEYDVFKFTEAVINRKPKLAFHIANVLMDSGVQSINMLGTLYQSIKNLLLVQVCENDDVENTTGLDSKQVYFTKKNVGKFTTQKLIEGVHLIADTVDNIKNGLIDEQYAVSYVLVNML